MLTHPTGLFSGDYISSIRGCWPLKFLHTLQPLKCISSQTWGACRPHVGLCPIFLVSYTCIIISCMYVLAPLYLVSRQTIWRSTNLILCYVMLYVCEKKSHFRKKTFSCVIRLMLTTVVNTALQKTVILKKWCMVHKNYLIYELN